MEEEVEEDNGATVAPALGEQGDSMLAVLKLMMQEQRRADVEREERKEQARLEREAEALRRQEEHQAFLERRQQEQQAEAVRSAVGFDQVASRYRERS